MAVQLQQIQNKGVITKVQSSQNYKSKRPFQVRHPQGNGKTDRFNTTLLSMIKCYIQDDRTEWDLNLESLTAAYRSCLHENNEMNLSLTMLFREVRLAVYFVYNVKESLEDQFYNFGDTSTK